MGHGALVVGRGWAIEICVIPAFREEAAVPRPKGYPGSQWGTGPSQLPSVSGTMAWAETAI